jgi:hypothetical protein
MKIGLPCRQAWQRSVVMLAGLLAALIFSAGFPQRPTTSAKHSGAGWVIPVQLTQGRPWLAGPPPPHRDVSPPANRREGLSSDEQKRLNQALNSMTPKQRKQFQKAVKRMSPEQRQKFVAYLKQRLGKPATAR